MQTDQMVFSGTAAEQALARDVWLAMRMLGASFGERAPIRQPLTVLSGFFAKASALANANDVAAALDATLTKNAAIFQREVAEDGAIFFVTTKAGQPPASDVIDASHMLRTRLTEPPPAPVIERPIEPAVVAPRVADDWLRPTVVSGSSEAAAPEAEPIVAEPVVSQPAVEALVVEVAPAVEPALVEPVIAVPAAVEAVPIDAEPAAVAAALKERLLVDPRLVCFGNEWFLDDQTLRLSRNDFRRLKEYINERGEPLADIELLNDVLGRRVIDRDFQLYRFGLNVRLSKEKKDFDFVGTPQSRLWSAAGLPAIGTLKRKPAELGQDYRFLLETNQPQTVGDEIEHGLTFYEYEYGLLPLDSQLTAFLPAPFIDDQRAAVLRLDIPQLYASLLVELRYPTANRGGFISGLDQLYSEHLIPGAVLTLQRTDNDGRYILKFGQHAGEERRLLHLDERRGRFVFRPVTYYCTVNEDLLLADSKFAGLNNAKALDERERRRPELVLRATFERVGDQVGDKAEPRYWALIDDLFAAANTERPFTREYLQAVLERSGHAEFSRDPEGNAYFYSPQLAQ